MFVGAFSSEIFGKIMKGNMLASSCNEEVEVQTSSFQICSGKMIGMSPQVDVLDCNRRYTH